MMRLSLLFFATSLISACGSRKKAHPKTPRKLLVENFGSFH